MGISEEFKEDIREAFEIYDKEKEGKFTKDGLGTILRSLGQNPTEGARVGVVTESKIWELLLRRGTDTEPDHARAGPERCSLTSRARRTP